MILEFVFTVIDVGTFEHRSWTSGKKGSVQSRSQPREVGERCQQRKHLKQTSKMSNSHSGEASTSTYFCCDM